MAFLSSVFSKLTETANIGRTRQTETNQMQQSLDCEGEVDDFVLFSNKNVSNSSHQDTGPPLYDEVLSQRNGMPPLPYSVNPTRESNQDDLPAYSELLKRSPIDDVPFDLWNGHMTTFQVNDLLREVNSIVQRSQELCDMNVSSRFKYSFHSEMSVLREFGDVSESSTEEDMLMDFGLNQQGFEMAADHEPRVACLVDI